MDDFERIGHGVVLGVAIGSLLWIVVLALLGVL
jgi:hypothetical protein